MYLSLILLFFLRLENKRQLRHGMGWIIEELCSVDYPLYTFCKHTQKTWYKVFMWVAPTFISILRLEPFISTGCPHLQMANQWRRFFLRGSDPGWSLPDHTQTLKKPVPDTDQHKSINFSLAIFALKNCYTYKVKIFEILLNYLNFVKSIR